MRGHTNNKQNVGHLSARSRFTIPQYPPWKVFIMISAVFLAGLSTLATASTTLIHAPRQHYPQQTPELNHQNSHLLQITTSSPHNNNNKNNNQSSLFTSPKIHVLPPSPDDTPIACLANATLHESCGVDRYCAELPSHHPDDSSATFVCLHKTLWFPTLDARDMITFLLTGACCFLAAMGGIGGGGLILPILLMCCNFTPKEAAVLSNTAVFCNTAGQFLTNQYTTTTTTQSSTTTTNTNAMTIIYATVLMIMPGLIAGGSMAITMEGMVPSTVILILALLTLLLASTKTYHKAQKMRRAEQAHAQQEAWQLEQQQQQQIPQEPYLLSPLGSPSSRSLLFGNCHDGEHPTDQEQEALMMAASSLEWGLPAISHDEEDVGGGARDKPDSLLLNQSVETAATPASKRSRDSSGLLDLNDNTNRDILQETFFGSIRFLNRETPEDNCALIIDESSVIASRSSSPRHQQAATAGGVNNNDNDLGMVQIEEELDDNDQIVVTNGNHNTPGRSRGSSTITRRRGTGDASRDESGIMSHHSVRHHVGICGRCCSFVYHHKLQVWIASFWALDAATFLLLHSGTLIHPCSVPFFILIACPALIAVIFVGLGRCHVNAARRREQRTRAPLFFDDEIIQPLTSTSTFWGSQDDEDDNGDEDDDEDEQAEDPVPTIESPEAGQQPRHDLRTTVSSLNNGDWVLLLPLVSVVAGILKAFQSVPHSRRQVRRGASTDAADEQDVPFLDHSRDQNNSLLLSRQDSDEESLHDEYKSLLSWWLPYASVLIGLLSALLGIGGGELLGPILLLLLRMDPQQSSATTAIMSMMNSGTNLLHYVVADMMTAPGYAINLGMAGLLGGSGGRLWAMSIAQKGNKSIICMSLCFVLSLATALVAWELISSPFSWESKAGLC